MLFNDLAIKNDFGNRSVGQSNAAMPSIRQQGN